MKSLLETIYSQRMSQILVAQRKFQKPVSLHAGRKKRVTVFQGLQSITEGELQVKYRGGKRANTSLQYELKVSFFNKHVLHSQGGEKYPT